MNLEEMKRGLEKCDICSSFKGPPGTTDDFVSGDHRYCQCPTSSTSLIKMRMSSGANGGGGGWYRDRLEGGARQEEEHFGNRTGEGASNRSSSSSDDDWVHMRADSTWQEERKSLQKKLQEAEELIRYKDIEIEELVNAHRQLRGQNSQREKEKLKEDLQHKTEQLERAKTEIAKLQQYVLVYQSYFTHLVARAREAEAQVDAYRHDAGRERQTLYQMQLNLNQNASMPSPGTEPSLRASQSMDQAPATTGTTAHSPQQSVRILPPRPGYGRLDASQSSRSTSRNHPYGRLEIDSPGYFNGEQSGDEEDEETMVIGYDCAVPSSATMDIPTDDQEDHL